MGCEISTPYAGASGILLARYGKSIMAHWSRPAS